MQGSALHGILDVRGLNLDFVLVISLVPSHLLARHNQHSAFRLCLFKSLSQWCLKFGDSMKKEWGAPLHQGHSLKSYVVH
jgi:hypothetical protein